MTLYRPLATFVILIACLLALPIAARAGGIEQKVTLCSVCHGAQGVPVNANIPIIWGENEGYLYLELRDLKLGNRKSAVMSPIAASLAKSDLMALAAYFSAKKWPDLNQPAPPADEAKLAEKAINAAVCQSCHLDHWQGNSTTPRIGGQEDVYLQATMTAFRDGTRANNPWMTALLKTYSDKDIDALAAYLAAAR